MKKEFDRLMNEEWVGGVAAFSLMAFLFVLFIASCIGIYLLIGLTIPDRMSNRDIINETKVCTDAKLNATLQTNGWNSDVLGVICKPEGQ